MLNDIESDTKIHSFNKKKNNNIVYTYITDTNPYVHESTGVVCGPVCM